MNIVLIGFMGAGKTTVAKIIQEKIGWDIIEMDDLIVRKSGLDSVNEIFEKEGEIGFRELERGVAKELSAVDNKIISTGGGVIMSQLNMLYLKKGGKIFYLKCDWTTFERRLKGDATRPLFQNREKAKKLYEFRSPLYEFYADEVVDGNSSKAAAEEIIKTID